MRTRVKVGLLIVLVAAVLAGLATQFVTVQQVGNPSETAVYTGNAGELTDEALVGQTFTATEDNLSGISIMLATYSGRANGQPIILHIRESIQATQDIRTVSVSPRELGDNQYHRFTFEPLPTSANTSYFFFVTAPGTQPGNAATVDLTNQDPYPSGSAYIARAPAAQLTDPALLQRSGKQTLDVVFAPYYTVPLRTAIIHQGRQAARVFITTWTERRSTYLIWGRALVLPLIFIGFLGLVLRTREDDPAKSQISPALIKWGLLSLLIIAGVYRYLYAIELPITTDEGNYLYDARTLQEGKLAGGDGYVKAPLMIIWVMLWQLMMGDTIIAGRLASISMGVLSVWLCYFISRHHLANAWYPN